MTAPQAPFRYPMRTKIVIVAVLAVAFTGFALAVMTADTDGEDEVTLSGGPGQSTDSGGVVARSPRDGAQALSQQPFSIRLEPGWTGELTFQPGNGTAVRLPVDEIDVTALNELIYQPAEGKTIERLPEGTTSCVVATIWDRVKGREATEKVDQWCFAVT